MVPPRTFGEGIKFAYAGRAALNIALNDSDDATFANLILILMISRYQNFDFDRSRQICKIKFAPTPKSELL